MWFRSTYLNRVHFINICINISNKELQNAKAELFMMHVICICKYLTGSQTMPLVWFCNLFKQNLSLIIDNSSTIMTKVNLQCFRTQGVARQLISN